MNEALAILHWYAAMGVDETLEESPQDRRAAPVKPEPEIRLAAEAAPIAPLNPSTPTAFAPAASLASAAPAAMMAEIQALADAAQTLEELEAAIRSFKGLSICKTATQPVFAEGVAHAPVMVIGEAPGAEEDRRGVPFCGPSGQLLDKILAAVGLSRQKNCYITNSLFWRPPGNRTPSAEEIALCRPFVEKHIALQKPRVLLLTGGVAIRSVLESETSISHLRGTTHSYSNQLINKEIPTIATYHPSYLLRQPNQKKLAWRDILALEALLDEE